MKLSSFLAFKAIVALAAGLSDLLIPATVLLWYGVTPDPIHTLSTQYIGVGLIALGLVSWFARIAADSEFRWDILLALFIADTVGFVVALLGQLSRVIGPFGWVAVAIWLLLALSLGYFRFVKPRGA